MVLQLLFLVDVDDLADVVNDNVDAIGTADNAVVLLDPGIILLLQKQDAAGGEKNQLSNRLREELPSMVWISSAHPIY